MVRRWLNANENSSNTGKPLIVRMCVSISLAGISAQALISSSMRAVEFGVSVTDGLAGVPKVSNILLLLGVGATEGLLGLLGLPRAADGDRVERRVGSVGAVESASRNMLVYKDLAVVSSISLSTSSAGQE